MVLSRENATRITDLLKNNPQGLSITDIVKKIAINRNTAGRCLDSLLVSGQVEMRHFGMAKIYTASQRVPVSAMLSDSSDLIMQLDSNLRIVFANEPFLTLLRVNAADLFGKNIEYSAASRVFDDAFEDFIACLKTGISGKEWHGTLELNKGDLVFSCHIAPAVFDNGRKGVSVRLEDLTELRHREIALQESEARLRSIINAAPVGIGVIADRVIIEVNPLLCQMTGCSEGELIGKSTRVLYPTERDFDIVGRDISTEIGRNGSGALQTRLKKKNGDIIDILLSFAPINSGALIQGITIAALDISKRIRAEQALHKSDERYRTLIDISPDPVCLYRDGKIIYVNHAALTLVGASHAEEMVGKFVIDFIHPESHGTLRETFQKERDGVLTQKAELRILRLDGTSVKVEGRGVQTLIEGKPAMLVTIRDIPERRGEADELSTSINRYRRLVKQSSDTANQVGKNTVAPEAALALMGEDAAENSISQFDCDIIHPKSRKNREKQITSLKNTGIVPVS